METITRIEYPNYSGTLFNKGNTQTPFSTLIGASPKTTNHFEFATGQSYDSGGGTQPEITEEDSLVAPSSTAVKRTQSTNVTQIFHETISVSYAKQSDMGTLSGINYAGQIGIPVDEVDFQAVAKMQKIAQDIEASFIAGTYAKSTGKAVANKTRGIVNAITTNVIDVNSKALTYWTVAEGMKSIKEQHGFLQGLVLGVDATTLLQLSLDASKNNLTVVPNSREINGIHLNTILTPLGEVAIQCLDYLPSGTAIIFNPDLMSPVFQPVPGKGNFFLEDLAKRGAGEDKQIFGQVGLDHGPEWFCAKFTNIKTTFSASGE